MPSKSHVGSKDVLKKSPPPDRIFGFITDKNACKEIAANTKIGENKQNGITYAHDWIAFINKKEPHDSQQFVYALVHIKHIVRIEDIRNHFFDDTTLNSQIVPSYSKINLFGKMISVIDHNIELPPNSGNRQSVFNLPEATLSSLRAVLADTKETNIFKPKFPDNLEVFCELADARQKKWETADEDQKALGITIMLEEDQSGVVSIAKYNKNPLLMIVTRSSPNQTPPVEDDVQINCIHRNGPYNGCQWKKRLICYDQILISHKHRATLESCLTCKVLFYDTCMGCYYRSRTQRRLKFEAEIKCIKEACDKARAEVKMQFSMSTSFRHPLPVNNLKRNRGVRGGGVANIKAASSLVGKPTFDTPHSHLLLHVTKWIKIRTGGQGVVGSAYTIFGSPGMNVKIAVKSFFGVKADSMFHKEYTLLLGISAGKHIVSLLGYCQTPEELKQVRTVSEYSLVLEYMPYAIDDIWYKFIEPVSKPGSMLHAIKCVKSLADQLLASINELYEKNVMHGDISRGNIMFTQIDPYIRPKSFGDFTMRLVDFGLGRKVFARGSDCGGTHFFAAKYWFTDEICNKLSSRDADLFQAMMVIVHFTGDSVIWREVKDSKRRSTRPHAATMQKLGKGFLKNQSMGWLRWLLEHEQSDCKSQVHDSFCESLKRKGFFKDEEFTTKLSMSFWSFSPLI
jgi:hypothetical protein